MIRLTDFREILRYVPGFRGRLFVIAIDGEIIEHPNFSNILLDIALLHNLNIGVAIVHGASHQIRCLASQLGQQISNDNGTGLTDSATIDLALKAANGITHQVLTGLASVGLPAVCPNAVLAHPAGILKGIDMQFTGRVERIDVRSLRQIIDQRSIPVLPPLGFDGRSQTYRLNSDRLAVEIASELDAIKIVYVTMRDGVRKSNELVRHLTVAESRELLKSDGNVSKEMSAKLEAACQACSRGVSRVHIINGRSEEGLLAEVFSNEGVGTLIYDDEYEVIRPATLNDMPIIHTLIHQAAENDEVVFITREYLEEQIGNFFVVEIDRNPVACAALYPFKESAQAELASVVVGIGHEDYGIGRRLISHLENTARARGFKELFCLSTQAFTYFQQKAGFVDATVDDLPEPRRIELSKSGRNSRVLKKSLH